MRSPLFFLVSVLCFTVVFAGISLTSPESDALFALREDLGVDHLWKLPENPCNWTGITCKTVVGQIPKTRVTHIVLSSKNLYGFLSPAIGWFSELRELSLPGNDLFDRIPAELGNCTKLERLNLGNNRFSGKTPMETTTTPFLTTLIQALHQITPGDLAISTLALFVFTSLVQKLTNKGPMLWPIMGIIPTIFFNLKDIYEWASNSLNSCGGTFPYRGMWMGGAYGVMTIKPTNIEHMLKSKFTNYPKGKYYRERFSDLLGDGIFNADGETWKEQRKAATSEMHSSSFIAFSSNTIQHLVHNKLLVLLENLAGSQKSVDLQDVLLRFTFDNICMAAFGVEPGCLGVDDLPHVPFAKAFEEATEYTLFRFMVPPFVWKPMKFLSIGSEKRLKEAVQTVHEFAEKTVSDRRMEFERTGDLNHRSDLLSRLMQVGSGYSDKFLKDFCISFILAGRDTSSVALAWFFWLLNENPHVENRILAEIFEIIKDRKNQDDGVFGSEELKRMEYLQAALSEALRLYPSVPFDFKEVLEDDVFPDGTEVKKGARVVFSIFSMARTESIWGKDCREFKPERWIKDGKFVSENQFKYVVFNAGPRLCIGKRFAYTQMKMVAASVLLRYKVLVVKGHTIAPKLTTTLYMKHGLMVTFKPRDHQIKCD